MLQPLQDHQHGELMYIRYMYIEQHVQFFFCIFCTVHLRIILVSNQLDAQFLCIMCLFESSTCFEQPCDHPQEDKCINP